MLQLTGHPDAVHALTFAPDGQMLHSAGRDASVRLWSLAEGKEVTRFVGHKGLLQCLALHPHGRILASGGADGKPRLWDVRTGALIETLPRQFAGVTGLAWLPGRNTLVAASGERARPDRGGEVKVVFHDGPHPAPNLNHVEEKGIWSLSMAANGPTMAWGGGGFHVAAWELTRQAPRRFRQSNATLAVALSPDGRFLASALDRTVKLWDIARGHELASLDGHLGQVRTLAFSPDGRTLATAGFDKIVRLWSIGEGVHERRRYEWQIGAVHAVTFSADGLLAAAAGSQGTIAVWDVDE